MSLTITEGGYHVNQATGSFDDSDPAIRADIKADQPPTTAFGFITEALARRRTAGIEPFAVMSCDNIQGNGTVAREMITAFATLRDPELGEWISDEVAFPNSMVDRITPVTTDADREHLAASYGIDGRVAGRVRALRPVGAGGPLPARPPGVRGRRACRSSRTSGPTS